MSHQRIEFIKRVSKSESFDGPSDADKEFIESFELFRGEETLSEEV